MTKDKKIMYSGMQPTDYPSIGNYIGAVKNWRALQDQYNSLFCVVDMHSITVRQEPAALRKRARDLIVIYLAAGLDPEKCILYYQSHVPAHAELTWVLNCFTYMGELNRMTQFKDKSAQHAENINAGLYTYPVLMASDILLYNTDLVPVGEDQRQHIEICRDIATRFNNIYGDVFTIPEPIIGKIGARIMSLQEPTKKMSKSESVNDNNVIYMLDEPNIIRSKVKKAVTDSFGTVKYGEDRPGVSNLISIYCAMTGASIPETEERFEGKDYGFFKANVADAIIEELKPVQDRFKEISANKDFVDQVIREGAEKANHIANRTISKVYKKVGFPSRV